MTLISKALETREYCLRSLPIFSRTPGCFLSLFFAQALVLMVETI